MIRYQDEINSSVIAASRRVRNKFPYTESFYDDLRQEGMVAAYEAMENFDADQGVSVATYLFHRIYSHLKRFTYKQMQASGMLSLDHEIQNGNDAFQIRTPIVLQYESHSEDRLDINTMVKSLKPRSRALVIDRYFYNHTLKEMEPTYHRSHEWIRKDLQRILCLLRSRYNKNRN